MTTYSVAHALAFAYNAGFRGNAQITAVAIATAESGLRDDARHVNPGGTVDRGIVQFNSYYHREVSDACAYDAQCAFDQFYRVSSHGTNFHAWTTYNVGAHLRYMGVTTTAYKLGKWESLIGRGSTAHQHTYTPPPPPPVQSSPLDLNPPTAPTAATGWDYMMKAWGQTVPFAAQTVWDAISSIAGHLRG